MRLKTQKWRAYVLPKLRRKRPDIQTVGNYKKTQICENYINLKISPTNHSDHSE